MTDRLDRLEARGQVRRRPDPEDGRGGSVRLTARGRARVDAAVADLAGRELPAGLLRAVRLHFERAPDADVNGG